MTLLSSSQQYLPSGHGNHESMQGEKKLQVQMMTDA